MQREIPGRCPATPSTRRLSPIPGHDRVHTSELELGNRTPDSDIAKRADSEGRVVITKDRDFWVGHLLDRCPRSLLVVATGNIANSALLDLFETTSPRSSTCSRRPRS
ncbi:DUF5615 family PIN-like protein [Nocardia sp. NPDC059180]|uniref:DUF5615 family PIN-like protein n=1 Tax=Nocardia sp. NPDC059180 TaxID=3346761 RepID=UPI0036CE48FE